LKPSHFVVTAVVVVVVPAEFEEAYYAQAASERDEALKQMSLY
jgi:hypothetical protein